MAAVGFASHGIPWSLQGSWPLFVKLFAMTIPQGLVLTLSDRWSRQPPMILVLQMRKQMR